MQLDVSLAGRPVLVVGRPDRARRAVAALDVEGAVVELVPDAAAVRRLRSLVEAPGAPRPHVVVWVDGDATERTAVERLVTTLGIPLAHAAAVEPTPQGHVTLVGGGPGEGDLLTVAGLRALAGADVVLHDRLGPTAHLADLAPGAQLVDVGKTPGHHAVPQREIEERLVAAAQQGLRVVRLKGGDPFVFGRGMEEVLACRAAGVPVSVVPGVTSAIAVPEEAGIPVTHREVSRTFTVLSGHVPFTEDELEHLVGLGGTIVVLMGVMNLPHTAAGLRRHGLDPSTPLAVLERGFSDEPTRTVTSLQDVEGMYARFRSPAVIVIGDVVRVGSATAAAVADLVGGARA